MKWHTTMDVNSFKKLLHEGAVAFSFKKNDGTIRAAKGTLCGSLIPKREPIIAKFKVNNIEWDFDNWGEGSETGKPPRLHKSRIVEVTQPDIDAYGYGPDGIDNVIGSVLEKMTGFAVKHFDYAELSAYDAVKKPKVMPAGSILFYDLERGGFRSLKESSLIEFKKA